MPHPEPRLHQVGEHARRGGDGGAAHEGERELQELGSAPTLVLFLHFVCAQHVHAHSIANSLAATYSERDANCVLRHCTNYGIPVVVTMLYSKTRRVFDSQKKYEEEFNTCVQRVVEYAGKTKHRVRCYNFSPPA